MSGWRVATCSAFFWKAIAQFQVRIRISRTLDVDVQPSLLNRFAPIVANPASACGRLANCSRCRDYCTLACEGSEATISGLPLYALTFPVTQTCFPRYFVSGSPNFARSFPHINIVKTWLGYGWSKLEMLGYRDCPPRSAC